MLNVHDMIGFVHDYSGFDGFDEFELKQVTVTNSEYISSNFRIYQKICLYRIIDVFSGVAGECPAAGLVPAAGVA